LATSDRLQGWLDDGVLNDLSQGQGIASRREGASLGNLSQFCRARKSP